MENPNCLLLDFVMGFEKPQDVKGITIIQFCNGFSKTEVRDCHSFL
jgi:hypothetical protein